MWELAIFSDLVIFSGLISPQFFLKATYTKLDQAFQAEYVSPCRQTLGKLAYSLFILTLISEGVALTQSSEAGG